MHSFQCIKQQLRNIRQVIIESDSIWQSDYILDSISNIQSKLSNIQCSLDNNNNQHNNQSMFNGKSYVCKFWRAGCCKFASKTCRFRHFTHVNYPLHCPFGQRCRYSINGQGTDCDCALRLRRLQSNHHINSQLLQPICKSNGIAPIVSVPTIAAKPPIATHSPIMQETPSLHNRQRISKQVQMPKLSQISKRIKPISITKKFKQLKIGNTNRKNSTMSERADIKMNGLPQSQPTHPTQPSNFEQKLAPYIQSNETTVTGHLHVPSSTNESGSIGTSLHNNSSSLNWRAQTRKQPKKLKWNEQSISHNSNISCLSGIQHFEQLKASNARILTRESTPESTVSTSLSESVENDIDSNDSSNQPNQTEKQRLSEIIAEFNDNYQSDDEEARRMTEKHASNSDQLSEAIIEVKNEFLNLKKMIDAVDQGRKYMDQSKYDQIEFKKVELEMKMSEYEQAHNVTILSYSDRYCF